MDEGQGNLPGGALVSPLLDDYSNIGIVIYSIGLLYLDIWPAHIILYVRALFDILSLFCLNLCHVIPGIT